jgi:plasmid stability protein
MGKRPNLEVGVTHYHIPQNHGRTEVSVQLTNEKQSLVRDLDDAVYERLKVRAAGNNRSLEAELREILVLASKQVDVATARAAADAMRRRLEGRPHSDSGEILAEERLR